LLPASTLLVEPQRQDVVTRFDQCKVALENGWITVNEVRAVEGLPSVEVLRTRELTALRRRLTPSRFHRF
jgi:hypothetical protein